MRIDTLWRAALATAAILVTGSNPVAAQSFGSKPITLLIGLPPGGSFDIAARLFTETIGNGFGRPIIIENKPGATGMVAANVLKLASPDGHTLMLSLGAMQPAAMASKGAFNPL